MSDWCRGYEGVRVLCVEFDFWSSSEPRRENEAFDFFRNSEFANSVAFHQEVSDDVFGRMQSSPELNASGGEPSPRRASVLETLTALVQEGASLQAEVLTLSSELPPAFQLDEKSDYSPVLFDFKYLKNISSCEQKVAKNGQLSALDNKAKEEFSATAEAAFDVFRRIVIFYRKVVGFLEDVEAGSFVQSSLEAIVQDPSRQVALIETLYCVGSIFLLADKCLPDTIREKLLVAYFRYSGVSEEVMQERELIMKLCRRTGYIPGQRHLPQGYPEEYLGRFPLEKGKDTAVRLALHGMVFRDRDIYHNLPHYPDPNHRTTGLSHQAAYVFVLLFYVPHILHSDAKDMQRIVERFFCDRWVIEWAASQVVDLGYEWDRYKAAKVSLRNVVGPGRSRKAQLYWDRVSPLVAEMGRYLKAGGLHKDTLLEKISDIFNTIKEANVTARWILLHSFSTSKKVQQVADYGEGIVKLLLNLAALEYEVQRMYQELLDSRQSSKDRACQIAKDNLNSLSDLYQNPPPGSSMTHEYRANLSKWLQCLSDEVDALGTIGQSQRDSPEKLRTLREAFKNLGQWMEVATPGSRKLVHEIRDNLGCIQQLIGIRLEFLDTLRIVGGFSYALKLIHTPAFVKQIQNVTQKEPRMLWKLGCLLRKMRSVMDLPIFCRENTRPPVAVVFHFEKKFSAFGNEVFSHIPGCICESLDIMAFIYAKKLAQQRGKKLEGGSKTLSGKFSKLNKKKKGIVSQTEEERPEAKEERTEAYAKLAKRAARIAQFAQGVAAVEESLRSVVSFPLHSEMAKSVRRHVAKRLAALSTQKLHFKFSPPPFTFRGSGLRSSQFGVSQGFSGTVPGVTEFEEKLYSLKDALGGYCHALESVQDYLSIPGFGLWQDKLAHVIALNLRKECHWMITTQEAEASGNIKLVKAVSQGKCKPDDAATFMGRLCREIMRLTSPMSTHYSSLGSCWLDAEGTKVFGMERVEVLRDCIGSQGVAALDTVLAGRVSHLVDKLHGFCGELDADPMVTVLAEGLQQCKGLELPGNGAVWYVSAVKSIGSKVWTPLLEIISAIGQSQLVRRQMALELRNGCMLDGPVSLQRSLTGISDYMSEKYLIHRGSYSPTNSGIDVAHNQFYFQDSLGDDSDPPLVMADSQELINVPAMEHDAGLDIDDTVDYRRGINIDQLRMFTDTLPPSEDNSTGSNVRESSGSINEGVLANGESYREGTDISNEESRAHGLCLSKDFMNGEGDFPETSPGLGRISEDGLAVKLELVGFNPTVSSEPCSSVGKMGDMLYDGEHLRRGHWRSGMLSSGASRISMTSRRRRSGGLETVHRHSEGSSSVHTATSISNSSFWETGSARMHMMSRFGGALSDVSSGGHAASQASLFFARSPHSSFQASFFAPAPTSFDANESLVSIEPNSPTIHGVGPPGVFSILQGTGFLNPMEVKYTLDDTVPTKALPTILFFTTISVVNEYEFHRPAASLMRPIRSAVPDPASFIAGLVTLLFQYNSEVTDEFLRYIGQYIRAYLKTATGPVARGMVAAGVAVSLPGEVKKIVAFVTELCKVGEWARESAEKFIPPCILDALVFGEKLSD
ncbi:hypothetical protein BSKO_04148 [Bryopsis sp. KO-2023]|nr:hypothetical protein BSKO_04148 [Bryopsis sp. KO-2023]